LTLITEAIEMSTAKDVIRNTLTSSDMILDTYLADLSDDDLLVAAVPGTNPLAWQLGHVIVSERQMLDMVKPGASPVVPSGFEEAHGKETAAPNPFKRFCSKADYVEARKAQRAATLAVLETLPDADLDKATGVEWAPTYCAVLNMIGLHQLWHATQAVPVRRKLGKPIVM
jgi:hypothetical protein